MLLSGGTMEVSVIRIHKNRGNNRMEIPFMYSVKGPKEQMLKAWVIIKDYTCHTSMQQHIFDY